MIRKLPAYETDDMLESFFRQCDLWLALNSRLILSCLKHKLPKATALRASCYARRALLTSRTIKKFPEGIAV